MLEDADDVRVAQTLKGLRFAAEAPQRRAGGGEPRVHHLQGHGYAGADIARAIEGGDRAREVDALHHPGAHLGPNGQGLTVERLFLTP